MIRCDRPDCHRPATHQPTVGPDAIEGWEHLCCDHTDQLMAIAATATDTQDGVTGWLSWLGSHTASCGPRLESGDHVGRDYLRRLLDQHNSEMAR